MSVREEHDPIVDPGEKALRRAWLAMPWLMAVLGLMGWLWVLGGGW